MTAGHSYLAVRNCWGHHCAICLTLFRWSWSSPLLFKDHCSRCPLLYYRLQWQRHHWHCVARLIISVAFESQKGQPWVIVTYRSFPFQPSIVHQSSLSPLLSWSLTQVTVIIWLVSKWALCCSCILSLPLIFSIVSGLTTSAHLQTHTHYNITVDPCISCHHIIPKYMCFTCTKGVFQRHFCSLYLPFYACVAVTAAYVTPDKLSGVKFLMKGGGLIWTSQTEPYVQSLKIPTINFLSVNVTEQLTQLSRVVLIPPLWDFICYTLKRKASFAVSSCPSVIDNIYK